MLFYWHVMLAVVTVLVTRMVNCASRGLSSQASHMNSAEDVHVVCAREASSLASMKLNDQDMTLALTLTRSQSYLKKQEITCGSSKS
eukprot:767320-Hanusia_phi.AAC.10